MSQYDPTVAVVTGGGFLVLVEDAVAEPVPKS